MNYRDPIHSLTMNQVNGLNGTFVTSPILKCASKTNSYSLLGT